MHKQLLSCSLLPLCMSMSAWAAPSAVAVIRRQSKQYAQAPGTAWRASIHSSAAALQGQHLAAASAAAPAPAAPSELTSALARLRGTSSAAARLHRTDPAADNHCCSAPMAFAPLQASEAEEALDAFADLLRSEHAAYATLPSRTQQWVDLARARTCRSVVPSPPGTPQAC